MADIQKNPFTSKEFCKFIGHNLKNLREKVGLTQGQLGDLLNVTVNAVASNEQGKTFPRIPTLAYLADYYGVTTDSILGRDKITVDPKLYEKLSKLAALANMPVNDFVNMNLENLIDKFYPRLIEITDAENRAKFAVQSFVDSNKKK